MPFFKGTFETLEFDTAGYVKALDKRMQKIMRAGARMFVRAALARIPVRTGFVAGSMGNLRDMVGLGAEPLGLPKIQERFADVRNPKTKKVSRERTSNAVFQAMMMLRERGRTTIKSDLSGVRREYYYPPGGRAKVLKTPNSGRDFATPAEKVLTINPGKSYGFQYRVNISYFRVNDEFKRIRSAPWRSFKAGETAFVLYLKARSLKEVPRISEFIVKTVLEITKEGRLRSTKTYANRVRSIHG